jgi:hypothetical protein
VEFLSGKKHQEESLRHRRSEWRPKSRRLQKTGGEERRGRRGAFAKGQALEHQTEEKLRDSERHEDRHHILTVAVTLLHVAIAIATIAIIVRGPALAVVCRSRARRDRNDGCGLRLHWLAQHSEPDPEVSVARLLRPRHPRVAPPGVTLSDICCIRSNSRRLLNRL